MLFSSTNRILSALCLRRSCIVDNGVNSFMLLAHAVVARTCSEIVLAGVKAAQSANNLCNEQLRLFDSIRQEGEEQVMSITVDRSRLFAFSW